MANNGNTKKDASAGERKYKAFEMRKLGKTYRQIGAELGFSHVAARKAVYKILQEMRPPQEDVDFHRNMLLTRYEFLIEKLFDSLENNPDSANAIHDRILKTLNQIADITGVKEKTSAPDNPNNDLAAFADMLKQACLQ